MDESFKTTIDGLYAAILGALKTTYGDRFETYAPYDPDTFIVPAPQIQTPAIYLQIGTLESGTDDRYRTAADVWMILHIVCSTGTADLQVALDVLASSVLVRLLKPDEGHHQRANGGTCWGLGLAVMPAADVSIDEQEPGWSGYGSRCVQWRQTVYLPDDPIQCLNEPV